VKLATANIQLHRGPIRTCVGCGVKQTPQQMVRIAARAGGEAVLVTAKSADGRSAYLCRTEKCVERAFLQRGLERSLKLRTPVPAALKDAIQQAVKSL
jgi:hypothetical protein